jgi:hypothetical protein
VYLVMRGDREGTDLVVMRVVSILGDWARFRLVPVSAELSRRGSAEDSIVHRGRSHQLGQAAFLRVLIVETGPVTERLHVREIDDDEGRRLVRIIRRGGGSVVTWRRAQMVLLSAQGMAVPAIAKVAFTSEDRVRDVIRNFSADGFDSLYPK